MGSAEAALILLIGMNWLLKKLYKTLDFNFTCIAVASHLAYIPAFAFKGGQLRGCYGDSAAHSLLFSERSELSWSSPGWRCTYSS
jgi:hypothetical protein